MGNKQHVATNHLPSQTYSQLIDMGFNETICFTASKKHPSNINNALNYITKQQQKSVLTEDTPIHHPYDYEKYMQSKLYKPIKLSKSNSQENDLNNLYNLSYDKMYKKFAIKSNDDSLKITLGYCHLMEHKHDLSNVIPYDVILILDKFCFNETFDIYITDYDLQNCIYINSSQSIAKSLPYNSISTIYGNIIVKNNDSYSWTVGRNKFSDLNRNFLIGVIQNNIECLFDCMHCAVHSANKHGYFIDLVSLMKNNDYLNDHNVDLRVQISLDLNERSLFFYLLINGKVVNHIYIFNVRKGEYRLGVCLFGEGTEIQIC